MKGKFALLLATLLLLGVFSMPVTAPSTKTIDGDPSDWTGTPGADNTWVISNGEGIWTDKGFDDTGNGSYIYPNCSHYDPLILDYAGDNSSSPPAAWAYTDKYVAGTEPKWYGHGGMVDLREFRITADDTALYIMLRFENMGSFDNAVEWNYWCHNATWGWDANATGWGKIITHVYIDTDRIPGSGRTDSPQKGNFLIDPSAAWEECLDIQGDNRRFGYENWPVPPAYIGSGLPRVLHSDGTETLLNQSSGPGTKCIYTQGNCDIYPSCIELKVPYWALRGADPRGKTWRFTVVCGGSDEGYWRQVWNTTLAQAEWGGAAQKFRFAGGEGGDDWMACGFGNDPNIIDMAFTASQAEQEALLNSFGSGLVVVDKYRDVIFSSTGDVSATPPVGGFISPLDKLALMAPWIALAVVVITAASVVYRRKHIPKTI